MSDSDPVQKILSTVLSNEALRQQFADAAVVVRPVLAIALSVCDAVLPTVQERSTEDFIEMQEDMDGNYTKT